MSSTAISRAQDRAPRELPTEVPPNARRAAAGMAIVLTAQLMLILDAAVMNVALPRIGADLSFGPASLSWVLNGYTVAFGGLLLLGGRIGDVFGRRRTFWSGLAVFTLFSLVGGFANSPEMLVAARALQGVGAALAAPSVLALLTTNAPDEAARNRALALFSAVSSGGATIGLLLGGILTDVGSWRWTMFINVPIGIAVLVTVRRFVNETPRRPGRFDFVGAIAATGSAVSVVWALIGAPEHGWGSLHTLGGLLAGALLLTLLAVTEARHPHPLLRPSLLRSRRRVTALIATATMVGAQFPLFFIGVQYLENQHGFGPVATGLAFLPTTLGIFLISRVTPRLVGRFGPAPLAMTGTAGIALSSYLLSGLDGSGPYLATVFLPFLINGIAAGLSFMPLTVLVLSNVEPEHAGSASGLLQTMQQLGGSIGLAVVASVYAAHAVPGSFLPGVREAFLASVAMAAIALIAVTTLVVRRPRPAPVAELD